MRYYLHLLSIESKKGENLALINLRAFFYPKFITLFHYSKLF